MGFLLPRAKAGLRQLFPDCLPPWQLSKANFNAHQDESPDVVKTFKNAFAAGRFGIQPDRFEGFLSHKVGNPVAPVLCHRNAMPALNPGSTLVRFGVGRPPDTATTATESGRPMPVRRGASGVRGLLIYCADYKGSHGTAISADRWPDDVRLSDIELLFVCQACGSPGCRCQAELPLGRTGQGRAAALGLDQCLMVDRRKNRPPKGGLPPYG
jgi:hypothetical protein